MLEVLSSRQVIEAMFRTEHAAWRAKEVACDATDRWHAIKNAVRTALKREGIPHAQAVRVSHLYATRVAQFSGWPETWDAARQILIRVLKHPHAGFWTTTI
jgi:hypothetical protein